MSILGYLVVLAVGGLLIGALARLRNRPPGQQPAFGRRNVHTEVHFLPGCLIYSLVASVVLTILLNLLIRAF